MERAILKAMVVRNRIRTKSFAAEAASLYVSQFTRGLPGRALECVYAHLIHFTPSLFLCGGAKALVGFKIYRESMLLFALMSNVCYWL